MVEYNKTIFFFQIEQINQEYKIRALQFHPDKNAGDKEMEEKFQLLNVSTIFPSILGVPSFRQMIDRMSDQSNINKLDCRQV